MSEVKYGIVQGAVVSATEDVLDLFRRINAAGNDCRAFDIEDLMVAPLNEGRAISELGVAINLAQHVSVRDEESLRVLRSWGLARPIDIYNPDEPYQGPELASEPDLRPEEEPGSDTITSKDAKDVLAGPTQGSPKPKAESKKSGKKAKGKGKK